MKNFEIPTATREQIFNELREQCNEIKYGKCTTVGCIKKGCPYRTINFCLQNFFGMIDQA